MYNLDQIEALKELVGLDKDQEEEHYFGSAINPGNLGGKKKDEEIAKPHVKMEVKTFNRDVKGGATSESLRAFEEEQKRKKEMDAKTSIWTEEEVNIQQEELPDDRPQPRFEVL